MEKTYIIGFDIVEPQIVFETFMNFGLKIIDFLDHTNVHHIVFEGSKKNLKRWYEEYYATGESFEDYFNDYTGYANFQTTRPASWDDNTGNYSSDMTKELK